MFRPPKSVNVFVRTSLVILMFWLATATARAVDPLSHITQYAHTAWRIQDGFFTGAPTAIAQTADGYLWIGTANGLFRFDGLRFVPWPDFAPKEQLMSAEVSALLGARDGSLWIGAGYRVYRWKNKTLSQFSNRDEFVDPIIENSDGGIWLARQRNSDQEGPLCQVQGPRLHCYGQRDGIPLRNATALVRDPSGDFWVGGDSKLLRWHPGSSDVFPLRGLQNSEGFEGIKGLVADRSGTLWVGLEHPGPGLGLEQFRHGAWTSFTSPNLNGAKVAVSRLYLDQDGALWVGTDGQGVYRISNGNVDHFDSTNGLTDDKITALFQDHEGTIWIATSKGIDSFRDLPVVTYSRREGLSADDAQSIVCLANGTIWIGNDGSLEDWRNGTISSIMPKDGLPGRQVTSLLEDPLGGILAGIDNGLFSLRHGKFVPVLKRGGTNIVFAMSGGVGGNVWVASSGMIASRLSQIGNHHHVKVWRTFPPGEAVMALAMDPRGRLWVAGDKLRYLQDSRETPLTEFGPRYGYIRNIAVDGNEFVWFGATRGLIGFKDGKMQVMTTANGLPCERINTLILDDNHALWLYAQCGLIRIDHTDLENWWRNSDTHVKCSVFDAQDGFQGGPSPFRPASTKSPDGRLWFVNGSVVQTIDPSHLYINQLPPPVHIEQIIAGNVDYSTSSAVHLPKLSRNIEIKYTGLSFVIPQRVRFRYKLDGYESTWQEAGTRRSAFYTNLHPGTYTFLVTACNNSGVWNTRITALKFEILPAWYQTLWFRFLALLCLAGLGYVSYLVRIRQYAAALRARFNERLGERVRIARELHDTLLQSFHGLMFQFQAARNLLPDRPESAMLAMDETILATEQALAEGRDAIRDLRPEASVERDLAEMLTAGGQEWSSIRVGNGRVPEFRVLVEGKPRKMSAICQEEIYRIGNEVIRNAFSHAAASNIEVEVRYDEDGVRLRIRDDGKGIEPADLEGKGRPGHWGLQGIRERAQRIGSQLIFWSETGAGTEVELRVPGKVAYEKHRNRGPIRPIGREGRNGRST